MKTRNGFVSNSSSSSFVVIGARMKNKELAELGWMEKEDGYYEETDSIPEGITMLYDDDDYVVGISVAEGEDYFENTDLDLNEVKEAFQKAKKLLGDKPIKLLVGTRAC